MFQVVIFPREAFAHLRVQKSVEPSRVYRGKENKHVIENIQPSEGQVTCYCVQYSGPPVRDFIRDPGTMIREEITAR
jgi:hypothetical protein